jgi:hypothetical protein
MATIQGTPICTLFGEQMHVAYCDADGSVIDDYYDSKAKAWFRQNISRFVPATPPAIGEVFAMQTEGELHTLFRDSSNHIIHVYFGEGWRREDLTVLSQAIAASSDPVALVYERSMQVFYRDARNQIALLRVTENGWIYEDLSKEILNVPSATGKPSVLVFFDQLHIVFPIAGGDLFHLYKIPHRGWRAENLMSVAKNAKPAAGAPFLMSTVDEFHVLYRDTSDAISHVYYANGWHAETLDSKVGGAPGAKGDPCGLVYDKRMRVFFRAKNDDIYEFYFAGGDKWGQNNLSALAGDSVGASGSPTTMIYAEQNHVFYRDAKGRLADLYSQYRWLFQVINDKVVNLPRVGRIRLKNEGAFVISQRFVYIDTDGLQRMTGPTSGTYPIGDSNTAAPSDYGVPDGAEVWTYADVVSGKSVQAHLPCINRTGASATARFHVSGTTQHNDLHFDGVSPTAVADPSPVPQTTEKSSR